MTEIRFKSPEEIKEDEIEFKMRERGPEGEPQSGIFFDEEIVSGTQEKKKYVYIGNPYSTEGLPLTKLETEATREDIETIKREIIPTKESAEMLEAMAVTYKNRQPLLIEGPTAIGKTYLMERFTEMIYGRGTKPLDFYCSGQTDVSELMAKWVPKTETEEEKKKWNEFLELSETRGKISEIAQEVEGKTNFSQERKLALIHIRLQELAKSAGLSEETQWRFQYGAVPKAMGLTKNPDGNFTFDELNGAGFNLHIEEVGLAEPQVINALLKLRGKSGRLTEEIQVWENGGKKVKSGPKFWVYFSTNPPEEYLARNEIDPALARGVVFKRMKELSPESLYLASDYYFTYRMMGEKPKEKPEGCLLDIYNHPEIGKEISTIVSTFHNDLNGLLKVGEKGRRQRIPLSLDDMARVADGLITEQARSKETGFLDLPRTLKNLIEFYYLNRLADESIKKKMLEKLDDMIFNTTGVTGLVEFEGKKITRKEMFDMMVERASLTEEEKIERAKREAIQVEASLRGTKPGKNSK
jgi:hypothetical protein